MRKLNKQEVELIENSNIRLQKEIADLKEELFDCDRTLSHKLPRDYSKRIEEWLKLKAHLVEEITTKEKTIIINKEQIEKGVG